MYKKGRKVTHIKFHTEKQQIPIFPIDIPVKNMEADDLLNLVPEQHRRKKKHLTSKGILMNLQQSPQLNLHKCQAHTGFGYDQEF